MKDEVRPAAQEQSNDLANLRPSTAPAIALEVLRDLPTPGIYVHKWRSAINDVIRITGWDVSGQQWYKNEAWNEDEDRWERRDLHEYGYPPIHYPQLPAFLFAKTAKQIAAGTKDVTRRKTCPKWCKPGALFNAWDRSFRVGRGKARGLGVHRVVSVYLVERWGRLCRCGSTVYNDDATLCGSLCGNTVSPGVDTITPDELVREGFPDLSPDEFWRMLTKLGAVVDGKTWRIGFERA